MPELAPRPLNGSVNTVGSDFSIQQAAIDAYLKRDASVTERIRLYGAALSFTGLADNGGLLGGGIENCLEADTPEMIGDAVAGLRLVGLTEIADLIARARCEYVLMRPGGASQELSDEADELWRKLDERWFGFATADLLDQIDPSAL